MKISIPGFDKYLNQTRRTTLEPLIPEAHFRAAVVIPALAEFASLPHTLASLATNPAAELANTMILVVVNSSPATPRDKKIDNQKTLAALRKGCPRFAGSLEHGKNLFWIDAETDGHQLTANGGVGEARKIGMDCSLRFLDYSGTFGLPLLLCLDADTRVENNYLPEIFAFFAKNPTAIAATVNFTHQRGATNEMDNAINLYELFMRYYCLGLRLAGSPYAFHALGSAMVTTAAGYVKCGGMRARNGGEDFYFLQAARKVGLIGDIKKTTVYPAARPSDRVPFGTGPRLKDILSGNECWFYHPRIFSELKKIIQTVENIDKVDDFIRLPALLCDSADTPFARFTREEFRGIWHKIFTNTHKEIPQLRWAFHTWFDAFRTLKFIHFCEHELSGMSRLPATTAIAGLLNQLQS